MKKQLVLTALLVLVGWGGFPERHAEAKRVIESGGKVYRLEEVSPSFPFAAPTVRIPVFVEVKFDQRDLPGLVAAVRIATDKSRRENIFTFIAKGACGAVAERLATALGAQLPTGWQVRTIRNLLLTNVPGGGSTDQTTLLSSPSGRHYLIDTYAGHVQLAEMIQVGTRIPPDEQARFEKCLRENPPPLQVCNPPPPVPIFAPALGEQSNVHLFVFTGGLGSKWEPTPAGVNVQCSGPTTTTSRVIQAVGNRDPNDKVGSLGAGTRHFISGEEPLRYAIYFENEATATAPAQEVLITDQLDVNTMDLSTFRIGPISFGDRQIVPPPGLTQFNKDVDLRPGKDLIVRIEAGLDSNTGIATWRFTSIDPATGQLTEDPLGGFLPPNVNPPEGDGSVLFTVMPRRELVTGTVIRNRATIDFEVGIPPAPLDTPEWLNTIDNTKPESQVLALAPTRFSPSFTLQWSGEDVGSGILDYTIFVSEDNGPFAPFLVNTTETSAVFTGQPGKTYGFYSVARDQTGNTEDPPAFADATTQVLFDTTPPTVACSVSPSTLWPPNHKLVNVTANVTVIDNESGPAGFTLHSVTSNEPDSGLGDGDGANDIQGFAVGTPDTSGLLRAERSGKGNGRVYTLTYRGMDVAGNSATCSATVTVPHDQRR